MALEDGLTTSSKSLNEYFEALNHQEAIGYIEHLVQPDYVFRERDILNIHKLVIDHIDKDFAGQIGNAGVRISCAKFVPPDARRVSNFMKELIAWVNEEDLEMHPVIKAAVFHHRLI
jgi:Fic family protein